VGDNGGAEIVDADCVDRNLPIFVAHGRNFIACRSRSGAASDLRDRCPFLARFLVSNKASRVIVGYVPVLKVGTLSHSCCFSLSRVVSCHAPYAPGFRRIGCDGKRWTEVANSSTPRTPTERFQETSQVVTPVTQASMDPLLHASTMTPPVSISPSTMDTPPGESHIHVNMH
jgi:hypothetical protein